MQVPGLDERHHEVEALKSLEKVQHVVEEGMLGLKHHLVLDEDSFHELSARCNPVLPDALDGVELISRDVLRQVHLAKAACAQDQVTLVVAELHIGKVLIFPDEGRVAIAQCDLSLSILVLSL